MIRPPPLPPALRFPRLGWRNVLYIAFVLGCIGYTVLHQTQFLRPDIARMGVGLLVGAGIWAAGTLPFFLWNLVALVVARAKGRPASQAGWGVALPLAALAMGWPVLWVLDWLLVRPLR